jgi:tRNA(Leu) C34 or U34 (ribose-2'-O)-methylase TrmL
VPIFKTPRTFVTAKRPLRRRQGLKATHRLRLTHYSDAATHNLEAKRYVDFTRRQKFRLSVKGSDDDYVLFCSEKSGMSMSKEETAR